MRLLVAFGGLMGSLAAGYGVLFTIVADYREEYGISETAIGVVIGIGFIAGFLAQLTIAPLADRGHAKRLVLIGVMINVAGLVLMAIGTTLAPILIGRFVSGVGIGTASPAVKRIVILADPNNLGQNMGRLLAADVFGFAMGPAISAVLVGPFGIPAPFVVVAAITLVLVPFVARVDVQEAIDPPSRRFAFDLLRIRPFAGAVVLGAVAFVMIGAFDALWDVVHDDLGTSDWIANLGITLFGIPLVFLGPPGGRLAQTWGPFKLSSIGLFFASILMCIYGFLPSGGLIFAVAMVHAISDGLTISASGVAVGMVVPDDRQAGAHGVIGAAQAVSAGVMAAVTGLLYDWSGQTTAYVVAAAVMASMTALGLWLARSALGLRRPIDS
ncbi:MAG: MFS transporter [Ilumatobacter sp.]|nr:MFS transporter [Ilumatobacter sp.]